MSRAERGSRLVRHGMGYPEQRVRERHTRHTLRVVHALSRRHVAVVARFQALVYDLYRFQRQRIGERLRHGRNVSFDGVGQRVHTGIGGKFGRHGFRKLGIDDSHVGGDVEVRERIFNALLIVGYDRKRRNFGCRARGRGYGAEFGFGPQRGERERRKEFFKGSLGIFVEHPHRFCRVDRRTSAYGYDPVGLEFPHHFGAFHDRFHRRIGFDALEKSGFDTGFLKIGYRPVDESESFHRTTAEYHDGSFAGKVFELLKAPLSKIQISR